MPLAQRQGELVIVRRKRGVEDDVGALASID